MTFAEKLLLKLLLKLTIKAINATFLVAGWLTQGCEAFSDINFHLLGYTALGFDKFVFAMFVLLNN
jgi:hypothetical protein